MSETAKADLDSMMKAAKLDRDSAIEKARADFEAKLEEMRDQLLDARPIAPGNATAPPISRAAYSDRTALLMAKLAMLAYERFKLGASYERILCKKLEVGGLELVGTFSVDGTQGYVCKNDKLAVLAFRGTTDIQDWRTDLKASREVIKNHPKRVRAHEGFLNAYLDVEEKVLELLSGLYFDLPLYITGHSLGGALALVASVAVPMGDELTAEQVAAVYTFGAPRAGGGDFREIVKVPHYRVFNPWDLVPSLPAWWQSYQHTGDVRFLAHDDRAPLTRKSIWGGMISFGILRSAVLRLTGSSRTAVQQHDIKKYILRLENIAKVRNTKAFRGIQGGD